MCAHSKAQKKGIGSKQQYLYSSKVIKFVLIKTNLFFLLIKKEVCFDQYELDYLGRIKFYMSKCLISQSTTNI